MNALPFVQIGVALCIFLVPVITEGWCAAAAPTRLPSTNLLVSLQPDGSIVPVATEGEWQKRRQTILDGMETVMGALPGAEKRCALQPEILEEVDCGSYVRRSITYVAEPGSRVPAYLLIPKRVLTTTNKAPAVLALHQTHQAGRKVVVGLGNSSNDEYGVELVQRGFVVLAPPYTMLADYWPDLKGLGYRSGTMKSVWDNIRAIDLLTTLPFVSTNGFAAVGHSLGGHNGIFTAVFDQRIKVVISSCGLDAFVDYKNGDITGWTQERYMPRLKDYSKRLREIPFDFPELIAAIAPRTCLIIAPIGDSNFQWRSVDSIIVAAQPIFNLQRVPLNLQVAHPDCGHLFPAEMRQLAYRLIETTLKPFPVAP